MISIQVDNSESVAAELQARSRKIIDELGKGLQRAMIALARDTGTHRSTGQVRRHSEAHKHVLQVRNRRTGSASLAAEHKGSLRDSVLTMRRRALALPPRPVMRSSLQERRAAILAELQQAIERGLAS
jgi:hypothetical protein